MRRSSQVAIAATICMAALTAPVVPSPDSRTDGGRSEQQRMDRVRSIVAKLNSDNEERTGLLYWVVRAVAGQHVVAAASSL